MSDISPKTFWKHPLLMLAAGAMLFVALRGFAIAWLMSGRYVVTNLLFDFFAAMAVLVVVTVFDWILTAGLKRLFGSHCAESKWRPYATKTVRLSIILLVAGTFLLATAQLHSPKVSCVRTPESVGLAYNDHVVVTEDGIRLLVWSVRARSTNRPVIVTTHGLGSNKDNFLHMTKLFHDLDYHVVCFDFRGHGDSGGHTCSLGVRESEDLKAVHDFAVQQFPGSPVYGWSTSMGGAAALRAAAEHSIFEKLVVDATFSSVRNLAMDTKFCYAGPLAGPAWALSRLWYTAYVGRDINNYGPEFDIAQLAPQQQVFLIHGKADRTIPHTEADRLHAAAPEGTQLWIVEGAGHSGSFAHPEYAKRVKHFFEGGFTSWDET